MSRGKRTTRSLKYSNSAWARRNLESAGQGACLRKNLSIIYRHNCGTYRHKMTHEEKNIGGGAEHPGSDEQKISVLLSGLQRVEAPKDFDFHLKARIANAKPADYQKAGMFPILRYAMPLGLFLAVGAGVLVNSSYNSWQTPTVADGPNRIDTGTVNPTAAAPAGATDVMVPTAGQTPGAGPGGEGSPLLAGQPGAPQGLSRDIVERGMPTPMVPPGFSADRTVRPAPTPIVPPEFRGNSNTTTISNVAPPEMASKPVALPDALQSIGIEVELEENKWKVKSVKGSTIGELLGVKAGDKLESIDGRAVDDKTVYKDGSFKVKTIRVRRGETAVDLQMKKPQK